MVTKVIMPKFGLSMETGVIGSWLAKEGDAVTKGCAIAEITTDKISNTCESPADGILRKILLPEGEEAPCGEPIALIADTALEDISGYLCGAQECSPSRETEERDERKEEGTSGIAAAGAADVRITPRAKKVAGEQGLEYAHIKGTGLLGAITIADLKKHGKKAVQSGEACTMAASPVHAGDLPLAAGFHAGDLPMAAGSHTGNLPLAAGASGATTPSGSASPGLPGAVWAPVYNTAPCTGEDVIVKMSTMELTIAKAMQTSLQTTAQATIAAESDITNLVKMYKQLKGKYTSAGVKLSYTAMLIKAVAQALENHEAMRSTMADEGHLKISSSIHIGVAIDVPKGLVVPVIRTANMKDLRSLCLELSDLTKRAKDNRLTAEDMGGATMTITNLGMFGITYFTPVLNLPEPAILGVGAITEKLLVKEGTFYPGSVMNFSLTHDHRIINGAPAARFLQEVTASLKDFKWV